MTGRSSVVNKEPLALGQNTQHCFLVGSVLTGLQIQERDRRGEEHHKICTGALWASQTNEWNAEYRVRKIHAEHDGGHLPG